MELTWKEVLDCKVEIGFGGLLTFVEKVVKPSNYKYFIWNDRVYELKKDTINTTELVKDDIK